ncbi:hypothetical protein PV327_000137 [Microctonus hyperodae]|uniref:Fatty acyl-CoA reductase n=1 Tax=Microctonus hyperodae TaxID=165561 RepID=A0AA39L1U9_MICHY|nr:hypothetical protein PV327_000137 [Microctonus hyperodae]
MMEEIYQKISNENDFGCDTNEKSEIQEFFVGQTIFLTGCTGFLGKCFVEKLLRSCPGIKKLYLLVRPHKTPIEERMEKYFQHLLFDKLREMRPNFISKVVIIEGNLIENGMNLSNENRKLLLNEVTVIIHNASNVKFDGRTSLILRCNVLGTKYMLDLAKECKNLKCFSYVSTAYSHCYQKNIEEKCYPPPADLQVVQDLINVDEQTPNGLSDAAKYDAYYPWTNLYTYSKSIAESLVEEAAKQVNFACIIYRPSIVISTYQEPIVGWCGNINGPATIFLGSGLGLIHSGYILNYPLDLVPSDMCSNALFAIIWDVLTNRKENTNNVMVFNYGSSTVNPTNLLEFESKVVPRGEETPSAKMIGPHFTLPTRYFCWFLVLHFLTHFIPAMIADIALVMTLRKPQALSIWWKVTMNLRRIFFFGNGNWRIHVNETQKVWDRMNKRDQHLFFCDFRLFDWVTYGYSYWPGLRVYILKDPMTTLSAARRKYAILQGLYEMFKAALYIYILYYSLNYLLIIMSPLKIYVIQKYATHSF